MPVREEPTAHLLRDLAVHAKHRELRPVYRVSENLIALRGQAWDFIARGGKENLAQALILRILTPRGELAALAHPDYGSRVHELIGSKNTATQRNLLKLYILEAVKAEPRVEKVVELKIEPVTRQRPDPKTGLRPAPGSTVDVLLRVKPAGATGVVTIGPFTIELAL
jgi:phage baseplate assembly protein W